MDIILNHINKYKNIKERDLVKLLYQRSFGPGHLIGNKEDALKYLNEEVVLVNNLLEEYEDIGNNVFRVYFTKNTNLVELVDKMIDTCKLFNKEESILSFNNDILKLCEFIISNRLSFDVDEIINLHSNIKKHDYAPIRHSDTFNENYQPHYRIIKKDEYIHKTVLLYEAIEYLNIKPDGIYVDATLGGAGHSSKILEKLTTGHLYAFDADIYAINKAKMKLSSIGSNYTLINANFKDLKEELLKLNVSKIDGIIYDLGVSSFQFDIPERGFSYRYDAMLDMRMDQSALLTAKEVVNTYNAKDLATIFYKYADEQFSFKIADKIIERRKTKEISTTFELVDIIKSALPQKILRQKGHPAKKVFQALRIAVNDELNVFEKSLNSALELLNQDGRIVVITFHSLEDKICKYIFNDVSKVKDIPNLPIMPVDNTLFELISRKAILPSENELENNNRAHSAKMRVLRRK